MRGSRFFEYSVREWVRKYRFICQCPKSSCRRRSCAGGAQLAEAFELRLVQVCWILVALFFVALFFGAIARVAQKALSRISVSCWPKLPRTTTPTSSAFTF